MLFNEDLALWIRIFSILIGVNRKLKTWEKFDRQSLDFLTFYFFLGWVEPSNDYTISNITLLLVPIPNNLFKLPNVVFQLPVEFNVSHAKFLFSVRFFVKFWYINTSFKTTRGYNNGLVMTTINELERFLLC